MSYCVNCGVELDATQSMSALSHAGPEPQSAGGCRASAALPQSTEGGAAHQQKGTGPAHLRDVCLGGRAVRGAQPVLPALRAALVPLRRWRGCDAVALAGAAAPSAGMPLWVRLLLDSCAVGVYVYLISIDLHGQRWFLGLALPIILTGGAIVTALGLILSRGRSILSSVTLIIGAVGLFVWGSNSLVTAGWREL